MAPWVAAQVGTRCWASYHTRAAPPSGKAFARQPLTVPPKPAPPRNMRWNPRRTSQMIRPFSAGLGMVLAAGAVSPVFASVSSRSPQPIVKADANHGGANVQCRTGQHCPTQDGSPSLNRHASGKHGVRRTNPAHTGCTSRPPVIVPPPVVVTLILASPVRSVAQVVASPVEAAVNPLPVAAAAGQADSSGQLVAGGFVAFAAFLALGSGLVLRRRHGEE